MNQSTLQTNITDSENAPAPMRRWNRRHGLIWIMSSLWLATTLVVMAWLTDSSFKPGPATTPLGLWPEGSRIQRDPIRPTLILFMHPRCPCSRATIGELAVLASRCQGLFTAQVWFLKPTNVAENWTQTDLWRKASEIPGVSVHVDETGVEAHRFQALTSGHSMLYDKDGHLLFQGGITLARGHSGDNPGRSTLESVLERGGARDYSTPVFGCPLVENNAAKGGI